MGSSVDLYVCIIQNLPVLIIIQTCVRACTHKEYSFVTKILVAYHIL